MNNVDVLIQISRCNDSAQPPLSNVYLSGSSKHIFPFRQKPSPVPGNYIDFMNLYYTKPEEVAIEVYKQKLAYNYVKELAPTLDSMTGYNDLLLSRLGLKMFVFYKVHPYENLKMYFKSKFPVKEYKKSSSNIENLFLELKYIKETQNDQSLKDILVTNANNIAQNLLTETLKMEVIKNTLNEKSVLDIKY